jgi:hypothetical protein
LFGEDFDKNDALASFNAIFGNNSVGGSPKRTLRAYALELAIGEVLSLTRNPISARSMRTETGVPLGKNSGRLTYTVSPKERAETSAPTTSLIDAGMTSDTIMAALMLKQLILPSGWLHKTYVVDSKSFSRIFEEFLKRIQRLIHVFGARQIVSPHTIQVGQPVQLERMDMRDVRSSSLSGLRFSRRPTC